MRKPKAINPPLRIFLQVGELDEDCQFDELAEGEVTWCADSKFDTDIEYRLVRRKRKAVRKKAGVPPDHEFDENGKCKHCPAEGKTGEPSEGAK